MNANTAILQRLQNDVLDRLAVLSIARKRPQEIEHLDLVTCLPDRWCFGHAIKRVLQNASSPTGLLLIDIDHLKLINDAKGRKIGDRVLAAIAERLRTLGGNTTAFRLNGDEFALVVRDCKSQLHLDRIASDLLSTMASPITGHGGVFPRVTIGGAMIGNVHLDPGILRRNANVALCRAKDTMRGGYVAFDQRMHESGAKRARSLSLLETAIMSDTLLSHYQPIVNMERGHVVGVEALARIAGERGEVVEAEDFHSALQDPAISVRATDRILHSVAADFRGWLDMGLSFEHVGINLTTADLRGSDLAGRLSRIFGAYNVPMSHLVLEVNETVYLDSDHVGIVGEIEKLRDQGLLVALDDFGTGYASLTHLQDFPVDIVKIDKSFVRGLPDHRSSVAIVEGLVGIAQRMGMKVVPEGIETQEQADFLMNIGCTLGQGYLFGRPVSASEVADRPVARAPSVDAHQELGQYRYA